MRRLIVVVLLLVLVPYVQGQTLPVIDIDSLTEERLRKPVEFARVPGRIDSLEGIRAAEAAGLDYRPLSAALVNQGITDDAYWLRFRLSNPGEEPRTWLLHHETSYLDFMTVYAADEGEDYRRQQVTDRLPFSERAVDYHLPAYRHTTPAGSHTDLYIHLSYVQGQADAMSLNVGLLTEERFDARREQQALLNGLFFGNSISLMVISLVLALVLRHRVYTYYFLLVAATAAFWLQMNGYGYQYFWQHNVWWQNQGFHINFLGFSVLAVLFSRAFLSTAAVMPVIDRYLRWYIRIALLGILLRLAGFYEAVLYIAALYIMALVFLPVLGWLAWRRGVSNGLLFAGAWLAYGLTLLVSLLSAYTPLLHWGMGPLVFAQLGSLVENLMLLFATARRVMTLEEERGRALALASSDPLTGLGNRRLLSEQYLLLKTLNRRTDARVYFMLVDLDHFKQINDTHGHAAGDRVLMDLAVLLESLSRSSDVCIRYGGEEFAVLFLADNDRAAMLFADRLRAQFAAQITAYRGIEMNHTLSIGVTRVFDSQVALSEKSMLLQADQALYRAKSDGRNRVVFWSAEMDQ